MVVPSGPGAGDPVGESAASDEAKKEVLRAQCDALIDGLRALGDRALWEELEGRLLAGRPAEAGSAQVEFDSVETPFSSDEPLVRHGMMGRSAAMLAVFDAIDKFAATTAPVLILGESGTGKDLVARAIHAASGRAEAKMISENCAAIPESLLESTLFGHVRGAFTGAVRDHPGHFVAADGGTLFLDEIGDMPLAMQVKLLRALQEGEVRPVGASKVRKVDVRILAATNAQLEESVADGRFRQDLFYRLNVLRMQIPPLRERGDDIVLMAREFLAKSAGGRLGWSPAAEAALRSAPWPGNIRQLQNEVQRLSALCDGPRIEPSDLSPGLT